MRGSASTLPVACNRPRAVRVHHRGRHYQVDAIHLAEPSPQRTPVLYQAGSSTRGREFAAAHASCGSNDRGTDHTKERISLGILWPAEKLVDFYLTA
jgi:hypothetical protein